MRVVVTGGQGDLGARVVRRLRGRGHDVVSASRRSGVDLASGQGLAARLAGADAVAHCATSPLRPQAVDVGGTVRLMDAVRSQPNPPHVVHISIVGCDANPYGYYRAKATAEQVIGLAGTPATIVRATQFHALAALMARLGAGPFTVSIGDMAVQPVDVEWVAERLADVVEGAAPDGPAFATPLAGPEVFDVAELSALIAEHDGRAAPKVLRLPPVGGTMRSFAERTNLPTGTVQRGGRPFAEWLAAQRVPLPRGMRDHS